MAPPRSAVSSLTRHRVLWAKLLLAPPLAIAFIEWFGRLFPVFGAGLGLSAAWRPLLLTTAAIIGLFTVGWQLPDATRRSAWILAAVGLLLFLAEIPEATREWKSPEGRFVIVEAGKPTPLGVRLGKAAILGLVYAGGWFLVLRDSSASKQRARFVPRRGPPISSLATTFWRMFRTSTISWRA